MRIDALRQAFVEERSAMAGLGELLVRENMISAQELQEAQNEQKRSGVRLGASLVKLGMLDESKLLDFMSRQYHVPSINLDDFEIDTEVIKLLPEDVATKHQVVPVHKAGASLVVAMADPSNIFAIDDIKFLSGYNVEVVVANESQVARAIERYYRGSMEASFDAVMKEFDEDEIEFDVDDESANILDLEKSAEDA
ncbi:uncharacterized protein METZ01_LOCUS271650, partial [marine metagenome]